MEAVNGVLTGYGTAHCGTYPGGVCNEGNGIQGSVGIPDQGWHVWRVEWDRSSGYWATETIRWSMDGGVFHSIAGAQVGEGIWSALAHSPMYFILNVAVGGNWVSCLWSLVARLYLGAMIANACCVAWLSERGHS